MPRKINEEEKRKDENTDAIQFSNNDDLQKIQ